MSTQEEQNIRAIVSNSRLELLIIYHEEGGNLYGYLCDIAAENGHIDCLKYLHENGCPWSTETCNKAAKNGHIDCLKYLHENSCPWSTETCTKAATNGHLDCLEYAHENGCPWNIVKEILIPKWRAAVKIRPYLLHWIEDTSKTLYAETGKGRKCDYDTFVEDFNDFL